MLKIRLQRVGRINQPAYRIVVTEHARSTKTGKFLEKVGTYNPKSKQRTLNEARIKYWMSVGAQPSATMHNMLVSLGMLNAKKINVLPQYKAPAEAAAEEQKEEAEKAAEREAKEKAKAEHDAQVEAEAKDKEAAEKAAAEAPKEEAPAEEPETAASAETTVEPAKE